MALFIKKDIIFIHNYGYADVNAKKPVTSQTCFRIASISKIFTAIAIMQLVEEGKLALDDPVHQHVPWFTPKEITIRQLLFHGAGLKRDGDTGHWQTDDFPQLSELKTCVQKEPQIFPPLERFKYSNIGYGILGEVIAATSKMAYDDYVRKHILQRLMLTHTDPCLTPEIMKHIAQGYSRSQPDKERESFNPIETKALAAATGFSSNVTDLCTFLSAQMSDDERLLKNVTKKEMRRPQWALKNKEHWGIGYHILKVKEHAIYSHSGAFPGFITCIGFDSEQEIGLVVLTNSIDGQAQTLLREIFNLLYTLQQKYGSLKKTTISGPLTQYECTLPSKWGRVAIKKVNQSLVLYYPTDKNPFENLCELRHIRGEEFILESDDEFDYVGEKVIFTFDQEKLLFVKIGPNIYCPS